MESGRRTDPFASLKGSAEEYTVYDAHYEKIGRVDDLIVDEFDRTLYIGVKMGFFGTNSTIVPAEIVRVNDKRHLVEVSEPGESVKHAPHFGGEDSLTPELENHVRSYYGLEPLRLTPEHAPQGPYIPPDAPTYHDAPRTDPAVDVPLQEERRVQERFAPDERVDVAPGERLEREEAAEPDPAAFDGDRRLIEQSEGGSHGNLGESSSGDPGDSRWEPSGKTVGGINVHRVRR